MCCSPVVLAVDTPEAAEDLQESGLSRSTSGEKPQLLNFCRANNTRRHKTTRAGRRRQSAFRHCSPSNCFSLLVNSAKVSHWLKWSQRLSDVVSRCGVSAGTLCDAASDFGAFRQSELTAMHHTSNFFSKGKLWTKCCLYIKPASFPLLEQTLASAASDARYNNSSSTSATRGSCCNLLLWTSVHTEEGTALEVPKESCVVFAFLSRKKTTKKLWQQPLCSLLFVTTTLNCVIFLPPRNLEITPLTFIRLVKSEVMKSRTGNEENRQKEKACWKNRTVTACKVHSSASFRLDNWTTAAPTEIKFLSKNCDGWVQRNCRL